MVVPTQVVVDVDALRILLRAAHHCNVPDDRLLEATRAVEAVLPICGEKLRVEDNTPNGWGASAACRLVPGHGTRHYAKGESGGGWELWWGQEEPF